MKQVVFTCNWAILFAEILIFLKDSFLSIFLIFPMNRDIFVHLPSFSMSYFHITHNFYLKWQKMKWQMTNVYMILFVHKRNTQNLYFSPFVKTVNFDIWPCTKKYTLYLLSKLPTFCWLFVKKTTSFIATNKICQF